MTLRHLRRQLDLRKMVGSKGLRCMPVSHDDVRWAYRLILEREPESEDAIKVHLSHDSVKSLVRSFRLSAEYAGLNDDPPVVGQFLDRKFMKVETDVTPEQTLLITQRIAKHWSAFGENDPHWSVITSDEFRAGRIKDNEAAFYATGVANMPLIFNPLLRSGIDVEKFERALDFGCGVGRLSLALAPLMKSVVGLDISRPHVDIAMERALISDVQNVDFVKIDHIDDISNFTNIDLVVSLIVLQHNPPPVMRGIIEKLLGTLRAGGCAVLQFPTFIPHYEFVVKDYLASVSEPMEMNAIPQSLAFSLFAEQNCKVLEVREDSWMGRLPGISQTFAVQKLP